MNVELNEFRKGHKKGNRTPLHIRKETINKTAQ